MQKQNIFYLVNLAAKCSHRNVLLQQQKSRDMSILETSAIAYHIAANNINLYCQHFIMHSNWSHAAFLIPIALNKIKAKI
jgi:hypothetical protein